ncbi:MFS transporter [Mesorhizobium sp. GR13]|uniref:MFS transporter n=1 Tax=Mesorhizobium sp. GR13 TaxID=2562308 RepID=UPI0014859C9E|nr:MFS transporter [Mesorhizobium sp. GR13]
MTSRVRLMGSGMLFWSFFSALSGFAWSFPAFLITRVGVGIGEATLAPAATSIISGLFPSEQRAKPTGIYMLGIPLGSLLAFTTVGAIAHHFNSWRAPFLLSFVPGIILAFLIFSLSGSIPGAPKKESLTIKRPFRAIFAVPTFWSIALAGIACSFVTFGTNAFLVPLLQRHFGVNLQQAGMYTGLIVGVTGLIGLTAGGWIADNLQASYRRGRILMAAFSFIASAALIVCALLVSVDHVQLFVALFALGWLLQFPLYVCLYPALHDVIPAELRATSMSMFISASTLIGGSLGPVAVGLLSDHFALKAQLAANSPTMEEVFRAAGLHAALGIIPIALLCASAATFFAAWKFVKDADKLRSAEQIAR